MWLVQLVDFKNVLNEKSRCVQKGERDTWRRKDLNYIQGRHRKRDEIVAAAIVRVLALLMTTLAEAELGAHLGKGGVESGNQFLHRFFSTREDCGQYGCYNNHVHVQSIKPLQKKGVESLALRVYREELANLRRNGRVKIHTSGVQKFGSGVE